MKEDQSLFLYDLFTAAREKLRLSLGMEEYFSLLKAVRQGYGLVGKEELRLLCETLWVKRRDQQRAFRALFEDIIKREAAAFQAFIDRQKEEEKRDPEDKQKRKPEDPKQPKGEDDQTDTDQPADTSPDTPGPAGEGLVLSMEEGTGELALAEKEATRSPSALSHQYVFSDNYQPISARQMRQSWRFLRTKTQWGYSTDIDLTATVNKVAKEGFFHQLIYQPRYKNKIRLILMIDHKGSMVPFHSLANQLVDTATEGGGQYQTDTYFFRNCPKNAVYTSPDRREALSMKRFFGTLSSKYTDVMIFSDGGSARNRLDLLRLNDTWNFLNKLHAHARHVVWLNPMPRHRWPDTTAGELADIVPMFEATEPGFRLAIRKLRGKAH
ncbi:MAG: hypothetical protein R3350_00690 [Saprospiraceae bacterium]|nr:hypothetical protein [Saprospiraceae bacterium]